MAAEQPTMHGSVVVLGYRGVLIVGPSGSGKSTLAHKLIERWEDAGLFAAWVGDDRVVTREQNGAVLAYAAPNIDGLAELAHLGIHEVETEPSARLDLVVRLVPETDLERMPKDRNLDGIPLLEAPERHFQLAISLIEARLGPT